MEITPAALKAVAALKHAGFDAYPVGGCVRDSLVPLIGAPQNPSDPASVRAILDCAPSDWDIATNAAPEHVRSILDLLALRRADIAGHKVETCGKAMAACVRFEELLAELEAENACFSLKDLAVRGGDIMELGYRGPGIGKALRALLDAVVEERVPNEREALLELLRHDVMPGP